MKHGLLSYTTNNLGDEIQSLAAKQYLPQVDTYVKRDYLNQVESGEKMKIILNGWFSHHPENWPPSSAINPLFISFHITEKAKQEFTSPESIEYFSRHEPIGCRDLSTRNLLREHGVEAYFSGCLTLTLTNEHSDQHSDNIYLVDIYRSVLNNLPQEINDRSDHLTHNYGADSPEAFKPGLLTRAKAFVGRRLNDSTVEFLRRLGIGRANEELSHETVSQMKFQQAQEYLNTYAQAQLVITRRLHVALPCIAFGTPVILVHENQNDPRFDGLKQYINFYSIEEFNNLSTSEILSVDNNPGDIADIADKMRNTVEQFLADSAQPGT